MFIYLWCTWNMLCESTIWWHKIIIIIMFLSASGEKLLRTGYFHAKYIHMHYIYYADKYIVITMLINSSTKNGNCVENVVGNFGFAAMHKITTFATVAYAGNRDNWKLVFVYVYVAMCIMGHETICMRSKWLYVCWCHQIVTSFGITVNIIMTMIYDTFTSYFTISILIIYIMFNINDDILIRCWYYFYISENKCILVRRLSSNKWAFEFVLFAKKIYTSLLYIKIFVNRCIVMHKWRRFSFCPLL